jgi:Na+/H+ antiporter NhaD/arsenite permease-like protein
MLADMMLPSVPLEFVLFAGTLLGIALFHRHSLQVALAGLAAIVTYKLLVTGFHGEPGIAGFAVHLSREWVTLANLLGLLVGFALLAQHFHDSRVPDVMPRILPDDWKSGVVLLGMVFILSSFLDNIAAAMIGGSVAQTVYRNKVHLGFIAAIVAASNAGGSGSVVGDTTTTMMWIHGVSPLEVLDAYVAAVVATAVCAVVAARQQHRYSPILHDPPAGVVVDWMRLGVVIFILASAITANVLVNLHWPDLADRFPFVGAAVIAAIAVSAPLRAPHWQLVPEALKGSTFLLSLVLCASMMPVEHLPDPTWRTTLGLGFVSAVFDNIPLTALALRQGGYDWGMLAYAVGFGGSMIWFGSSAGVAISSLFPEARSVGGWVTRGWHVILAYVAGFLVLLWVLGWHPGQTRNLLTPASGHAAHAVTQKFS